MGKKALSSNAELIRTIISSKSEEEIVQSIGELLGDVTSLDWETVSRKVEEIMTREFTDYPELFATALDNQTNNPLSLQMIQSFINAHIEAIRSEKNRISRVKQLLQNCLADLQESFVKSLTTCASLELGKSQVIRAQELQGLTYEIFMENQGFKKSVKIHLMPSVA